MSSNKLSALAAALTLLGCGPTPVSTEVATPVPAEIINGEKCHHGDQAAAVAVLVDATFPLFGQIKSVVCTGTLIAPDVVLTAAHCVDASIMAFGLQPTSESYHVTRTANLTALAEQQTTTFPTSSVQAVDWVQHPNFDINAFQSVNGPGNFHDIALIFLSEPLEQQPAAVIDPTEVAQLTVGKSVEIVGWGQQTATSDPFNPPPPGTVGQRVCAVSNINELGTHEMQIGNLGPRKCHGDSGGPTFLAITTPEGNEEWRVVGVTSHAYDETDCAKGGVDTRVDVWRSWLDGAMSSRCSGPNPVRAWCDVPGIPPPSYFTTQYYGGLYSQRR